MRRRIEWPELLIGLGVLLLLSPAAVPVVAIGEPTYEYEAVQLSYDDGEFDLPPRLATPGRFHVDNIACVGGGRTCALERRIHEAGGWRSGAPPGVGSITSSSTSPVTFTGRRR